MLGDYGEHARLAAPLALTAVWLLTLHAGPLADISVNDLYVYSVYADLIGAGQVPYRDFAFEYPPLAAGPIALLGGGEAGWSVAMLAAALGAQAAAQGLAGARAAWAMVALAPLAGALARTHFDLLPAAITLAGLLAAARSRPALAGAVLGAGALMKLVPGLAALAVIAWLAGRGERSAATRAAGALAVVVVAGALPFALLGGFPAPTIEFHLDRPVQIESSPASVLLALGSSHVTGNPVTPDEFKSNGLAGGGAATVQALFAVALLVTLAAVLALAARRPGARTPVLAAAAATLAFVALGKVHSPQYALWLLPFAAVLWAWRERAPALLIAAAAAVTQLWFPRRYFDLVARDDTMIALVAARNLLLIAALAATVRALARSSPRAAARSSG